jgi:uncharacterized phage protein gp47/JayE
MPILFDTSLQAIIARTQSDVYNNLPGSNPYLRASFLNALVVSYAGRVSDFYLQGKQLEKELFMDTASQDFLETRWASYKNIKPLPASQAAGFITVSGTEGVVIPLNTLFQSSQNIQYQTLQETVIEEIDYNAVSMIRDGETVAVVVDGEHNLANNSVVTISGADQPEYNITTIIEVTGVSSFQFQINTTPVSPATGDIKITSVFASPKVESLTFGINTNLQAGAPLSILSQIPGVNNTAYVQFSQVSGGADVESYPSFRQRVIEAYYNPEAQFNAANIEATAKDVPGVTRVWVEPTTPEPGQVTVYFVEDNNESIMPSAQDIENVKQALVEIAPSNTYPGDIFVNDPLSPLPVDFTFTTLSPNTTSMQEAITANLRDYFTTRNAPGVDIPAYAYEAVIYQTIDTLTGQFVETFTLSEPSGDIEVDTGYIAVLGSILFP